MSQICSKSPNVGNKHDFDIVAGIGKVRYICKNCGYETQ